MMQANILIVDDEEAVRRIVEKALAVNGYECILASNAAEAREELARQKVDLLISDIRMPGESGMDLIRYALSTYPDIVAVVLTGINDTGRAKEALQIGVYGYLIKPFEPAQVLISVINALRRKELEKNERLYKEGLEQLAAQKTVELRDRLEMLEEAKKVIKESEENFRAITESAQDAIFRTDSWGRILYWNAAAERIFGWTGEEAVGREFYELVAPERQRNAHAKAFERFRETGQGAAVGKTLEKVALRKDGQEFPVELSVSAVKKDGLWDSVVIVRDISERKKIDKALQVRTMSLEETKAELANEHKELIRLFEIVERAKKEWERTMDCIQALVVLTDEKGKIVRVNRAVSEFTGKKYQELVGGEWPRFCREYGITEEAALESGTEVFHEASGRCFIVNTGPLHLRGDGLASGKVICFHDSTSLKRMAMELDSKNREIDLQRRKLAQALEELSSLIQGVAKEKDFSIRFSNPTLIRCYETKGCSQAKCPCYGKEATRCWQVVGTLCNGVIQGDFAKKIDNCCTECEVFLRAADDPAYQIGEHFNNMMHILESKNQTLQAAYKELKDTQALIIQQEKMASIGQLAAGVAHEINNPVGFISSNLMTLSEYLRDFFAVMQDCRTLIAGLKGDHSQLGSIDSQLKRIEERESAMDLPFVMDDTPKLLEECREGTNRIKKIVQDLKDFAHPGKQDVVYADINKNLESTLNIVWNELKYKAKVKKVYGDLPEVKCYPQQLNQVFMNLLVNAGQAIQKDGEITITTQARNGHVEIRISDTGTGIPEENLLRIFEPFFTTKEVGKGTGLGLNVAYNIVKKHKGSIQVESTMGKGTTFTVRLPLDGPEEE
jgi:PAS domain S-box-containing protein